MDAMQWLEALSYLVTIVGLPLAIVVFVHDRWHERQSDEEEIFLRLSDEYSDFMRLVIENADLQLLSPLPKGALTEEQQERKHALFAILVSLFERAYVLVYRSAWAVSRRGCGSRGRTTCTSGARARISAPPCPRCCTARIPTSSPPSAASPKRRAAPGRVAEAARCRRRGRRRGLSGAQVPRAGV
jgi:hypothetical protein